MTLLLVLAGLLVKKMGRSTALMMRDSRSDSFQEGFRQPKFHIVMADFRSLTRPFNTMYLKTVFYDRQENLGPETLPMPVTCPEKRKGVATTREKKKHAKENCTSPAGANASEISSPFYQRKQTVGKKIAVMSISRTGNGTAQACAACKYQRRKCAPDCILAPYFPQDRQRQFLNAHKLFGVSNITKIIKNLNPPEKDEAMRTIIFQSDVRACDPVGGCYRMIRDLQRQIEYTKIELDLVLHQLALCRAQLHQQSNFQAQESDDSTPLGCETVNADHFELNDPLMLQYDYAQPHQEQDYTVDPDNQHLQEDANAWNMQEDSSGLSSSSSLQLKQQPYSNEFDDVRPVLDIISSLKLTT